MATAVTAGSAAAVRRSLSGGGWHGRGLLCCGSAWAPPTSAPPVPPLYFARAPGAASSAAGFGPAGHRSVASSSAGKPLATEEGAEGLQALFDKASPEERRGMAVSLLRGPSKAVDDVEAFVAELSAEEARALGIAAMSRHFGTDFASDFKEIDLDSSGTVCRSEFKRYLSTVVCKGLNSDPVPPTTRQLSLFCLNSAIPFVVFGMLDNSIMLLGGDVVDDLIGSSLQLSTLACAAVANTFADVLGISIGNTVEQLTVKIGVPQAKLTPAQAELPMVRRMGLASGSFGILIGCCLGMFPLLFMDPERKALKEAFDKVDTEGSGSLAPQELRRVLAISGLFGEVDDGALVMALRETDLGGGAVGGRVTGQEFLDNAKRLKASLEERRRSQLPS